MSTKHTPGKWVAECIGSGGAYDNPVDVYEINNGYMRIAEHVGEENARLIAAAPDLLTACEAAEALIRDGGAVPINGETWKQLRAAIQKARGES